MIVAGDFTAMRIRDAIGDLADGCAIDPELLPVVRAAVNGVCLTADRGPQQFVVGVGEAALFNVDTAELIWPHTPNDHLGDGVPLEIVTNRQMWEQVRQKWEAADPLEWSAFIWRIAVPLSNRLGFVGAWR